MQSKKKLFVNCLKKTYEDVAHKLDLVEERLSKRNKLKLFLDVTLTSKLAHLKVGLLSNVIAH